jgi:hypothetical protein
MFWIDTPPETATWLCHVSRRLVKKWTNKARRLNRLAHRAWKGQQLTSKQYPGEISKRTGRLMDHAWKTSVDCLYRAGISAEEYRSLHHQEDT